MRLPGLWRPVGRLGFGYGGSAGGQNRHVHGDPAYPSEEALLDLLSHRSSPDAVAPDREELCRRLVTRADLELEVCVPPCATNTLTTKEVWSCARDEGRSLGVWT